MPLSRDEIIAAIAARKVEVQRIQVPEWGGEVCLRRLSANDLERTGLTDGTRDASVVAKVVAASVTDESGEPLFGEKDVKALADTDMVTAMKVFAECLRMNGLMDEAMEEMVASFSKAQSGESSSS